MTIRQMTNSVDYGPYFQIKPILYQDPEPNGLGPVEGNSVSTIEFYELI